MSEYEYDAFISYNRGGLVEQWIDLCFEEYLRTYLSFELGDEARIFRDVRDIRTGDKWRDVVASALVGAKCLVPIYTPTYFRSAWCSAEWSFFLERERVTGRDLVVPVQWHHADRFPPQAKLTQLADFREYAHVGAAFRNTEGFLAFERQIKRFCQDLARKIEAAPERDDSLTVRLPAQDAVRRAIFSRPVLRDGTEHG